MGSRHVRTLYEIHLAGNAVKARCDDCNHVKVFDAGRLWWLFQRKGWDQSISAIAQHLRCSECRSKRIVVTMTFEEPTGVQPTGPTDREWKQHIRNSRQ